MKKIYSILFALLALVGVAQAQTIEFVAGTDKYGSDQAGAHSLTKDGVTIAVSNGTLGRTDNYRVYKNQTLTVSSTVGDIEKIEMTCVSGNGASNFDAVEGLTVDGNDGIWTGSAASVSFKASTNQVRMTKVTVTIKNSDPNYVAKPQITPVSGTYYSAQTVTITADEGCTIYYTTDGGDPTASDDLYVGPFTVDKTTTVKAVAAKGDYLSKVVESVITIETLSTSTIEEIIAHGVADGVSTSATVVAISNSGMLLQDETGIMYAYTETAPEVVPGDVVTVAGSVALYPNGAGDYARAQFSKPEVTKTGTAIVAYPEPTVLDATAFDALVLAPEVKYVKVTGTVAISGNYYNLNISGASKTGSIVATQEILSQLEPDMTATLTGYFVYTTGSVDKNGVFTPKYGNIIVTDYQLTGADYKQYDNFSSAKADAVVAKEATDAAAKFAQLNLSEALVTFVKGSGSNVNMYLSDGNDGMLVYGSNSASLKAGDKISGTIKGKLYKRYGNTQLANPTFDVEKKSSDNEVVPQAVAMDILLANDSTDYENELVTLTNLSPLKGDDTVADDKITWVSSKISFDGYNDDFDQVLGTVVVRDNWNIAKSFVFNKNVPCEITGFVAIYIDSEKKKSVQIYPRSAADIIGGTDAVKGITVETAPAAKAIYTVAGQRVQNLNKSGLYIVNGKKVVVK